MHSANLPNFYKLNRSGLARILYGLVCRGSLSLFVYPKHQNYMATSDHKESAGPVDTIISEEHKGKPHRCVHSAPNHKIPEVEITMELLEEW